MCLYLEDSLEADFRRRGETEHGKVSDEPGGDGVAPPTGWSTGRADGHIFNLFPEELLSVVEAAKVLVLSEQLNGWLGAVAVQLRHVEVVHIQHYTLASRSPCGNRDATLKACEYDTRAPCSSARELVRPEQAMILNLEVDCALLA